MNPNRRRRKTPPKYNYKIGRSKKLHKSKQQKSDKLNTTSLVISIIASTLTTLLAVYEILRELLSR
nr:hypothetical protein [Clostridioides sp.]